MSVAKSSPRPRDEMRRSASPPPSVSVVIPYYNSSDTIGRALDSVAAQTVPVLEVIIVDDCSLPAQRDALDGLRDEHAPIPVRVLHQASNQGPAAARNRGWEAARGDWVAFLDSDDSWHPRRLELQCRALTPRTLMISAHSLVLSGDQEPPVGTVPADPVAEQLGLLRHVVRNPHTTSSVLIRRDVPVRFTAGRFYAEDYELWIRVAALGEVLTLPAPLAYFHKDPFGTSGLSSRIWSMIVGEHRTFVLLRRDGVLGLPHFLLAELVMAARIGRRLVLRHARRYQ
jgi:teichuronic acid biosynthesis glycosyltransferase TuaG